MHKFKTLIIIALIPIFLQGCAKPFEHTIFNDEIYGPWRSALGSTPQNCYGRHRQIPECLSPWKAEKQLQENPQSALRQGTLEQIRAYALYAQEGTSATWLANDLIYHLDLISPLPHGDDSSGEICRKVRLRVKPQRSDLAWQDLSDTFCFK